MRLEGLHHVTMITGDANANVDFYADVLGLRLVKKTVNFDQPDAYHLYFGDELGTPGSILTWFEIPGAPRGRAGAGMIHTLELGVASDAALGFWAQRLAARGHDSERAARSGAEADARDARTRDGVLRFEDPDGLALELVVAGERSGDDASGRGGANPPLRAEHPEVPPEHAILGIEGARAYAHDPVAAHALLTETLGFADQGGGAYRLDGERRHVHWRYEPAPAARGRLGAGTVHHIAWAAPDEDHLAWQRRVREVGQPVTEVRDRDYFRSIYFREPRGVLFEIATLSPGFAVDEDPAHLGEELRLPAMHEHLRAHLERALTPVANPRALRREAARA